jgi:small subunit ribosomal protein S6
MRRYETIFILRPNVGEDEITRVIESTTKIIIDQGGTIIELNKWGMKKLAYLIKKETLGYYVYCDFAGTPAGVAEIERKFRIDDSVLKYMTIKTGASISEEEIQEAVTAVSEKQTAAAEEEQETTEEEEETEDSEEDETEETEDN